MSSLNESEAKTILEANDALPEDLQNLHKEICRFFSMDDMNIIDRAQSASQFSAFVRSGYYARRRKKDLLEKRKASLASELITAMGLSEAMKYKFEQAMVNCAKAINEGMAFSPETARMLTDEVKPKILEYVSLTPKIEDIQMSIDYLNDMFEVSKNYSFNINTAAKLISSER